MYLGILFAVLSPAVYSIVNYFDKFFLEKFEIEPVAIAIFSGIIALLTSFVLVFIFGFHLFTSSVIISIILSGVITELYILPYFKALSLEDASTVIPLAQFVPLFIIIGDSIILRETLTLLQYIGSFIIIVSGIVLSLEKVNSYFLRPRKAFWHMIVASMLIALATLFFKYGVGIQNFWYILPYEGIGIFIGGLLFILIPKNLRLIQSYTKKLPKKVYVLMFANEIFFIFARYCSFFALTFLSASLVGVIAGLQPFFVLIYGIGLSLWFPSIFKEMINKKTVIFKLVAILFIFLGIALIFI